MTPPQKGVRRNNTLRRGGYYPPRRKRGGYPCRGYCEATGLTDAAGRGRLYAALDREARCSTDRRLSKLRERQKAAGQRRKDYMALTKLDAIAADKQLRVAFEGIVARETARAAK